MEFFEIVFDDFRDFRDVEVIVGRVVGDVPGSVEDGTKDFGLETLGAWLSYHVGSRMALYIFIFLLMVSFGELLITRGAQISC